MNDSNTPPLRSAEKDIWFNPEFDSADLESAQHVVMNGMPDPRDPFAEPRFETAIATEDDFEDDCPLCEMMRERVRAGERIEIMRVEWD